MGMLAGTKAGVVDVATGAVVACEGRDVRTLAGGWAVLDNRSVVSLDDDVDAAGGEAPEGVEITCVASGHGGGWALAGATGAHLFHVHDALGPVQSFEAVPGREEWYTPWGGPPDVRTITMAGNNVLVNIHVGGIARSVDAGGTWHPTIDIHADVHQVLGVDAHRAVAAAAVGLATSDDGGATWTVHDEGLHATYARSVAVVGDTVVLGVSNGPGGGGAALYRRSLSAGGRFERCSTGLPDDLGGNVDTFRLVASDRTAAVATAGGDVFVSADEGATWEKAATIAGLRCLALA